MAGTQISTSVTIINSLLGYQAVSLTNFNTSAESQIAAGSKVELASAFFTFASDEQPSGWSSIATAATAYITLTPSGSAGTQIVSAAYSSTAPEWSDSKQGWYTSALSATRYVGKVYKTSATQYDDAVVLLPHQGTTGPVVAAEKLVVSGAATVGGTLGVTGAATVGSITGPHRPTGTMVSDSPTKGAIFTALSPAIPTIGNLVCLFGGATDSSGDLHILNCFSHAERISSTEITIYWVRFRHDTSIPSVSAGRGSFTVASGDGATAYNSVTFSW